MNTILNSLVIDKFSFDDGTSAYYEGKVFEYNENAKKKEKYGVFFFHDKSFYDYDLKDVKRMIKDYETYVTNSEETETKILRRTKKKDKPINKRTAKKRIILTDEQKNLNKRIKLELKTLNNRNTTRRKVVVRNSIINNDRREDEEEKAKKNKIKNNKMKEIRIIDDTIEEDPDPLKYDGKSVGDIKSMKRIKKDIIDNLFEPIVQDKYDLSNALSILFTGNEKMSEIIKNDLKQEKRNRINEENNMKTIAIYYKCNITLFEKNGDFYKISHNNGNKEWRKKKHFFYLKKENNNKYTVLLVKRKERQQLQQYFVVENILEHENLDEMDSRFKVKFKNYDEEEWVRWNDLKENIQLEEYINDLHSRTKGKKFALKRIKDEEEEDEKYKDDIVRLQFGPGFSQKNTGKKISILGDILGLANKGGCYCITPYDTLDKKGNTIFKVGKAMDFKNRIEEYHTYFPNGVYNLAYLIEPKKIMKWDLDDVNEWKEMNKGKPTGEKEIKFAMKNEYYGRIERYIFKYLSQYEAERIHATTRDRDKDEKERGVTEWFYCDEDIIHEAFQSAQLKYGGTLMQYYLSGTDINDGEIIESINIEAEKKMLEFPNHSGKIIFNI
jgi:hypothetical protein